MFTEHNVLFLPTNRSYRWGDLGIYKNSNKALMPEYNSEDFIPMVITVITNDKIIKGDYVICINPGSNYYGLVFRVFHKFANGNLSLEHKELGINEHFNPIDFKRIVGTSDGYLFGVPKLSKDFKLKFITAHNDGKKITKILVKYKNETEVERRSDNTLIIQKIKHTWNREEYISGLRDAFFAGQPTVDSIYAEQMFQKYLETVEPFY